MESEFSQTHQATSDADDLADGIEFRLETPMEKFEDGHEIELKFASGETRTLYFTRTSVDPRGFVVEADTQRVGRAFTILEVAPQRFRVQFSDSLKDRLRKEGPSA